MDRPQFQSILEEILGSDEVYFQPPADMTMTYPAIVYQRDNALTQFADNIPYGYHQRYQVTVIARDPDSPIPREIARLPQSLYNRFFVANNLNHDVFTIFI